MSTVDSIRDTWLVSGMKECVRLARQAVRSGNYGLGAVVLLDGEVIGSSASSLVTGCDPTAHPEMTALREAAERVKSRYLQGAYLVSTLEPCPMCAAAAVWAKMRGIAYGASQLDANEWAARHPHDTYTWRQIDLRAADVLAAGTPKLELHAEVERAACLELFALTEAS